MYILQTQLGLDEKSFSNDKRQTGSIMVPTGSKSDNLRESWHRLYSRISSKRTGNQTEIHRRRLKLESAILQRDLVIFIDS